MPVPSTGAITLRGIFSEKNENDYAAQNEDGESGISLRGLSENTINDTATGGDITINTDGWLPTSNTSGQTGANMSGSPYSMSEFRGYDHDHTANAFPGSGEDSWFQVGGLGGDAPFQWGSATTSNAFFAQAGCNCGFQNDQTNDRIAMRWTTYTQAAASSYSYAYVGYDGFATNTFYAKCEYGTSTTGFVGTAENPASYSPATNTYTAISTSNYSPVWQWSCTVNSGSGTRSISSFGGSNSNPDWTVASNSSGANAISGTPRSVYLSATRGTGGPGGGGGGEFCIHEDMLVSTQRGDLPIDDIIDKAPPKIWSWNKDTNQDELVDIWEIKVVEHNTLYKINNIMLTDDHILYTENYTPVSVNPTKAKENYEKDSTEIVVGNKLMKKDGSLETVTSIEAYSGTHRTYAIKTSLGNFYADGVLVDSEI